MPFLKIIIDAESPMFKTTSLTKPVVNLILRDKILVLNFHMFSSRKCQPVYQKVVEFGTKLLFWYYRTETQLFLSCFKLMQGMIHVGSYALYPFWCRKKFHQSFVRIWEIPRL